MKKILVIYCHPWSKSFNHSVLEKIESNLSDAKIDYKVIDLYAEHFDPRYDEKEMELFHYGKTHDPLVTAHLSDLKEATSLIIITPIWWNDVPAMLKGFIDKVMKEGPGLSHIVTKTGVKGLLTNISSAYVLTTSTSPTFYLKLFCGNSIKKVFIKATLNQLGIKKVHWINFGHISNSKVERRTNYLKRIKQLNL